MNSNLFLRVFSLICFFGKIFLLLSHWLNSSSIQIQTSNQKALDCTTDGIQFLIQDYLLVISSNQQLIAILEQQCKVNGCPAFCITVEHQQKEQSPDFFDTTKNLHDKHHKAFIARLPDWTTPCCVHTGVLYLLSCFWFNFHKLLKKMHPVYQRFHLKAS